MSDDFTADPDKLIVAARSMVILSADLQQARAAVEAIDASEFGHPVAAAATEHFVAHWTFQGDRLATAVQSLGDRLDATAKNYRNNELATTQEISSIRTTSS